MGMKSEILDALDRNGEEPMTAAEIIESVHESSGIGWKGSSIRQTIGRLVTAGDLVNLDRDPETGNYFRQPCRYALRAL